MLTLRLDKELEERLDSLSKKTKQSKSHCAKEAIRLYLDEREDYEIGLSRLQDHADKTISAKEMKKRLGL